MKKRYCLVSFIFVTMMLGCILCYKTTKAASKPIQDGVYIIFNQATPCKCMDVEGASIKNSANVHIWDNYQNQNQQWIVKQQKDGTYTFQSVQSGLYLDVAGGVFKSGTNVQQYSGNDTVSQRWTIEVSEDEYMIIRDYQGNLALDVENAWDINGANIRLHTFNDTAAQHWKFVKVEDNFGLKKDGIYKITTKLDASKVLEVSGGEYAVEDGANVQIWDYVKNNNQKWAIKYQNGYYSFAAYHSGKMLDVSGGKTSAGTNIQQYTSNGTDSQMWKLAQTEDKGYYRIVSKLDNKVLDVASGKNRNGQNVQLWSSNSTDAQKWAFEYLHKEDSKSKPITFESKFINMELYNFSDEVESQFKGIICKKSGVPVLSELEAFGNILNTKISVSPPVVPRGVMKQLSKDKDGVLSTSWEYGGYTYNLLLYEIYKGYNVVYIVENKNEASMQIGFYAKRKDMY